MIVTALQNLPQQVAMFPAMKKALEFLAQADAAALEVGRVEIDGQAVYALVQAYDTLPAAAEVKAEGHQQYIDIQYIVSGEEGMGWLHTREVKAPGAYNPDKDVWNVVLPAAEMSLVRVAAGQAAIFYPEDTHAPKLSVNGPTAVKKIVVKVHVP